MNYNPTEQGIEERREIQANLGNLDKTYVFRNGSAYGVLHSPDRNLRGKNLRLSLGETEGLQLTKLTIPSSTLREILRLRGFEDKEANGAISVIRKSECYVVDVREGSGVNLADLVIR